MLTFRANTWQPICRLELEALVPNSSIESVICNFSSISLLSLFELIVSSTTSHHLQITSPLLTAGNSSRSVSGKFTIPTFNDIPLQQCFVVAG